MDALKNLPDRGCFGVVEGMRALEMAPAAKYVCCHDTTPTADRIIINGKQQLHDLYRRAHKQNATAAAKRQARQQLDDRSSKRHQHAPTAAGVAGTAAAGDVLEAALAAIGGSNKPCSPAEAGAGAAAAAAVGPAAGQAVAQQHTPGAAAAAAAGKATGVAGQAQPRGTLPPAAAGMRVPATQGQQKSSRQTVYSLDELKAKTNKELVDLLKARSCPVSGPKLELIRRLLDYQRRQKKAAQGTGGV